ncbi:MAG: hypothetical protein GY788_14760 [bacterium]|nr:hypothetical protein [bacterium]
MRVYSHERYAEVADFDPESGDLTIHERSSAPNLDEPVRGRYADLLDTLVVVFRSTEGELRLKVGATTIPMDDATTVLWTRRAEDTVLLAIRRPGSVSMDLHYGISDGLLLFEQEQSHVPTPMAEAENFDFGLFLANLARDPERRNRIYT